MARDSSARARICTLLATSGSVADLSGLATRQLKHLVDYQGSDVGFAQLLATMERDGQISREIRGKRTYRVSATPATVTALAAVPPARSMLAGVGQTVGLTELPGITFDHDGFNRALLRQLWTVVGKPLMDQTHDEGTVALDDTAMPELR